MRSAVRGVWRSEETADREGTRSHSDEEHKTDSQAGETFVSIMCNLLLYLYRMCCICCRFCALFQQMMTHTWTSSKYHSYHPHLSLSVPVPIPSICSSDISSLFFSIRRNLNFNLHCLECTVPTRTDSAEEFSRKQPRNHLPPGRNSGWGRTETYVLTTTIPMWRTYSVCGVI